MYTLSEKSLADAKNCIDTFNLTTPLVKMPLTKTPQGHTLLLKCENLQPSGTFKIRGATYVISRLSSEQKQKGVVAYSTGNHAQAVALAAKMQGAKATIVMSEDAPQFKIEATKRYGAEVIMAEPFSDARKAYAEEIAKVSRRSIVHPYDNLDIITGQATIGLELLYRDDIGAIFVPVGGGGLIAGIAYVIKQYRPEIKVIGVEPELERDGYDSFHQKKLIRLAGPSKSIADALKIQMLGTIPFDLMQRYVDDMVLVSEEAVMQATTLCLHEAHLLVEPSGAVSVAGALLHSHTVDTSKAIVCIASGGNTDLF